MFGKWKIKFLASFDPECGFKQLSVDQVLALPDGDEKEELMGMVHTIIEITETSFRIMIPVPQEALEEAKASGAVITEDGFAVMQESPVKTEDGRLYYLANNQGEIMGEEIDPWEELVCDENGYLCPNPMMTFEKM